MYRRVSVKTFSWLLGASSLLGLANCNDPTVILDVAGLPDGTVKLLVQSQLNGVHGQDALFDVGSSQVVLQLPKGSDGMLNLEVQALSISGCKIARSSVSQAVPTGLRPLVQLSTTLTPFYTMDCTQLGFATTTIQVGRYPTAMALADFNNDQHLDLAVGNRDDKNVSVLLGDGTGSLDNLRNYPLSGSDATPYAVVAADFNGDQQIDLATANEHSSVATNGTVDVFLGNGTGSFGNATSFPAGLQPLSLAVGDYNDDQKLDLAIANDFNPGTVSLLLGDGIGNFNAADPPIPVGKAPYVVLTADFNGDKNLDLATVNTGDGYASVLLGNGEGKFQLIPNNNPILGSPSGVIDYFNNDSKPDLIFSQPTTKQLVVMFNSGDGSFSSNSSDVLPFQPGGIAVADFNGDRILDVVVTQVNTGSTQISVLLGDGSGGFHGPTNYSVGSVPFYAAVGDFNGDQKPDIAISNTMGNSISILINQSQ